MQLLFGSEIVDVRLDLEIVSGRKNNRKALTSRLDYRKRTVEGRIQTGDSFDTIF